MLERLAPKDATGEVHLAHPAPKGCYSALGIRLPLLHLPSVWRMEECGNRPPLCPTGPCLDLYLVSATTASGARRQYFGTRSTLWDGVSWWPRWIRHEIKVVAKIAFQQGEVVGRGTSSKKRCRADGTNTENRPAKDLGQRGGRAVDGENVDGSTSVAPVPHAMGPLPWQQFRALHAFASCGPNSLCPLVTGRHHPCHPYMCQHGTQSYAHVRVFGPKNRAPRQGAGASQENSHRRAARTLDHPQSYHTRAWAAKYLEQCLCPTHVGPREPQASMALPYLAQPRFMYQQAILSARLTDNYRHSLDILGRQSHQQYEVIANGCLPSWVYPVEVLQPFLGSRVNNGAIEGE